MAEIRAEEVRIPRWAREAIAAHEEVTVVNHDRPAFVILNPQDHAASRSVARGRPLAEALDLLATGALPDPAFGADMQAVLEAVGTTPEPWAPS